MPSGKKMSAAAARRLRAELFAENARPAQPLSPEHAAALERFTPHSLTDAEWAQVRPVVHEAMRLTKVRGRWTFRQLMSDLTLYSAWCLRSDKSLNLPVLLDHSLIDEWVRSGLAKLDDTTRNTRRSRLRSLASHLNPGPTAPPRSKPIPRTAVKPPYTPSDAAAIERLVMNQPSAGLRRQLCAMTGLGLGAGLDSIDLRSLTRDHVEDRGDEGLWVSVEGERARLVPVRRRYEHLVRIGMEGLAPGELLLGREARRKNVTAGVVYEAVALGNPPRIEQARFRSTWLVALMSAPVPLSVALAAAGLSSASTLTDLLPFVVAPSIDACQLRGEVHDAGSSV